ncbi:MAG: DUF4418 family protein [Thermacetogeniaceae bacterium]
MEKKLGIIAGIAAVISLSLLIVPRIFPVGMLVATASGSMIPMKGFYAYQAEFLIALAALLVAGSLFILKGAEARQLSGLFLVLLGAIVVLIPTSWVIGVCPDDNHLTVAWTIIGGLLLILAGGLAAWLTVKIEAAKKKEENLENA